MNLVKVLLLVLLFVMTCGIFLGVYFSVTPQPPQVPSGWQTYQNAAMHYRIHYPSNWFINNERSEYVMLTNFPSNEAGSEFFNPGQAKLDIFEMSKEEFAYSGQMGNKFNEVIVRGIPMVVQTESNGHPVLIYYIPRGSNYLVLGGYYGENEDKKVYEELKEVMGGIELL